MEKLVSVIITSYKTNGKLKRAIKSILDQTYTNIEIIVIDDNNPNTSERAVTEKIINEFNLDSKILYIKHDKNKNGAVARNSGINVCSGEYIAFLDDDDFFLPTRIRTCVELLEKNPDYSGIYSGVAYKKYKNYYDYIIPSNKGNIQSELLINNNLLGTGSNIFIKKACMEKLNGFDERFVRFQDVEFMVRFSEFFNILNIEKILVVKDTENIGNIPNYLKMQEMVKLFLKKFNDIIKKYDKQTQIKIEDTYRTILYNTAVFSKNKEYIKEARKKLKEIRKIRLKERVRNLIFTYISQDKIKRRDCFNKFRYLLNEQDYIYMEEIRKV